MTKNLYRFVSLAVLLLSLMLVPSSQAEKEKEAVENWLINGTRTVGPGGNYTSITAAIADIQAQGLDGALILDLLPAYTSSGETFPLNFTNLTGISAVNTLTLRPQVGATNLNISGSNATAIINLDNANFVTIDGRAGGAGTNKDLTIENTNSSGAAIRFINEASNNTIKHSTVKGVTTSATSGVILFSTTTGANGNDNNTIDNCDIRDGATTPFNGIFSQGTTTTTAHNNSNNTISNNNILNFYAATNASAGLQLNAGNTDWTIMGNSFYQTAVRPAAIANSVRAIFINNTSGNNFIVTNNAIGGAQPGAGGTAWTTSGTTQNYRFVGIQISVGSTVASSVQGNIIRNMVWTTSSTNSTSPGAWCGIFVNAGLVNVGTTAGNTIGSGTGTGSINVTTSGNLGTTIGIGTNTFFAANFSNNVIGSITTNGTTTSINASLIGILATGGNNIFNNNTIGSTTTANSLNAATSASFGTVTGQIVTGIQTQNASTITNNTIANLNNNYVGTASVGQTRGIVSIAPSGNVITGNTVRNLTTTSENTGSGNTASVVGISQISNFATQNHTISQNTIHTLSNNSTAVVNVTGIRFDAGTSSGTKVISRNSIYGLSTGGDAGVLTGLHTKGKVSVQNNMIRLGANTEAFGANNTVNAGARAHELTVIHDEDGRGDFLFNSCYVGGTGVKSGTNNSYVIRTTKTLPNSGLWRNNIFVNERSNATTGGKHYIVEANGTELPTSDHNLFNGSGNGFRFGVVNGTDALTFPDWKGLTGLDGPSAFIDPNMVAPDDAVPNLHLNQSNPAVGAGEQDPLNIVPQDFDNDPRPNPPLFSTIGADENPNFTPSSDPFPPSIKYAPLTDSTTSNRMLFGMATITDNAGVPISGGNVPRMWYRRLLPTPTAWASTPGTLFDGDGSNGSWTFVIDYSLIPIMPSIGETYEYYVVAQDINGNVNSNTVGANHPDVNTQTAPPPNPKSYRILANPNPIITLCPSGCDVDGITTPNGANALLNASALEHDVTVVLNGSTTETGDVALNETAQTNFPPTFKVRFVPGSAVMTTHSGNSAQPLFRFNGARLVEFDGRFNGSGNFLTFRNENTTNPTMKIEGGAGDDIFRAVIFEGANTNASSAVVHINVNGNEGNDNIKFEAAIFRDLSNIPGVPQNLFLSQGAANVPNKNITLKNSDLVNFTARAIYFLSSNESALIQGNTICSEGSFAFNAVENDFQPNCTAAPRTTPLTAVDFNGDGLIDLNDARIASTLAATGARLKVADNGSPIPNVRLSANRFLITPPANSTGAQTGVEFQGGGTANLVNNQFTIFLNGSNQLVVGINNAAFTAGALNLYYNSALLYGTATGSNSTSVVETSPSSIAPEDHKDNGYFNALLGNTGDNNAVKKLNGGISSTYDFNVYYGKGASDPTSFFNITGSQVPFPVWRAITGGDTNSIADNFIADVTGYFADEANGNLNINTDAGLSSRNIGPANGYNPALPFTNAGTPIAGVTTDFNGNPRDPVTPNIGSDEYSDDRTLTTNGTLGAGNYDNINVGAGSGNLGGGVTTTLGGIINVSGTMSIDCVSMLAGASPSNYVVGNVKKDFCAAGMFDYPVGTTSNGNEYSPVQVAVTNLATNPSSLTVKANYGTVPSNPPVFDATHLDRFWTLTETGDLTADLLFNYLQTDVDGEENLYQVLRVVGGGPPAYFADGAPCPGAGSPCVDTGANTIFVGGVTVFSNWAAGTPAGPTAAAVSVGGRVLDASGRAVTKARVTMSGSGGVTHAALTNSFGYFRFDNVPVGETYIIEARHKRYVFAPRVVSVSDEITDLDLIGVEN